MALFLLAFIITSALHLASLIVYSFMFLFLLFFGWTSIHAVFFIKRMYAVIQPLSFTPAKAARHIAGVTWAFSKTSVVLVLKKITGLLLLKYPLKT